LPGICPVPWRSATRKTRDGPALAFAADQWQAFTARVKAGRFDLA
jgi:hypothetical protein